MCTSADRRVDDALLPYRFQFARPEDAAIVAISAEAGEAGKPFAIADRDRQALVFGPPMTRRADLRFEAAITGDITHSTSKAPIAS